MLVYGINILHRIIWLVPSLTIMYFILALFRNLLQLQYGFDPYVNCWEVLFGNCKIDVESLRRFMTTLLGRIDFFDGGLGPQYL